jgi:hypothetical protein
MSESTAEKNVREVKHFVCEYDHDTGKMVSMAQYDDHKSAVTRWNEMKTLHTADDDNTEAMLFEATSLDALRAAAPQYFGWSA